MNSQNPYPAIPADDLQRLFALARPDTDPNLPHIGVVGDTYTFLIVGDDTNGRFCLIDMHIPPSGGPAPHRHDFEETFTVLEGAIEATFRGQKLTLQAGQTLNVPSNAPHEFHNVTADAARLLCLCSPAGQEEFFAQIGVAVETRTTAPPKLDEAAQKALMARAQALAPKFRTELLQSAD